MPRAAQDELYLEGYGKNVADPRMTDHDSDMNLLPREILLGVQHHRHRQKSDSSRPN